MRLSQRTLDETEAFYRWEMRGRGWELWPYPVALAPPFVPFGSLDSPQNIPPPLDDGHKPSLFSSLVASLTGTSGGEGVYDSESVVAKEDAALALPNPLVCAPEETYAEIHLRVPHDLAINKDVMEQLLLSLRSSTIGAHPLSFEVIGTATAVVIGFCCRGDDAQRLITHVQAYCPRRDGSAVT